MNIIISCHNLNALSTFSTFLAMDFLFSRFTIDIRRRERQSKRRPITRTAAYLFFRYKPIIPEGRRIPLQLTAKHSAKLSIQLQNRKVCELWGKTGAMYIKSQDRVMPRDASKGVEHRAAFHPVRFIIQGYV